MNACATFVIYMYWRGEKPSRDMLFYERLFKAIRLWIISTRARISTALDNNTQFFIEGNTATLATQHPS